MRNGSIVGFLFCLLTIPACSAQNSSATGARDPVLVTISKETTRITEPLKESGYPDFLEAANIAAKGKVTPETNGFILLVRAVGPYKVPDERQAEFYERLGIDPLPEDRSKHVLSSDYVHHLSIDELPKPNAEEQLIEDADQRVEAIRKRLEQEFTLCSERPWLAKDHPIVSRWLEEQKTTLAQLDRLRDFPDAYLPQVSGLQSSSLLASESYGVEMIRALASDLSLRAQYAIGREDFDGALDDLERMFVIQNYLHKRPTIYHELSANALCEIMHAVVFQLALSKQLKLQQVERLKKLLDQYAPYLEQLPRATYAKILDEYDRIIMIEGVCRMAEFGSELIEDKPAPLPDRQNLDYDFILNKCNPYYDRYVQIYAAEESEKSKADYAQLDKELQEIREKTKAKSFAFTQTARSTIVAEKLLDMISIGQGAFYLTTENALMRRDLWHLSFALGQYRRKIGQFPAKLEELLPEYIKKLPTERYTEKPLKYQTDGKGILVYSIGRDEEDHQGYDGDNPDGPRYDDIAIFTEDHRPRPPKAANPSQE